MSSRERVDLRLAVPALGAWAAAALAVGSTPSAAALGAALVALVAVVAGGAAFVHRADLLGPPTAGAALALLATAVALSSVALQLRAREVDPIAELVVERAVVQVVGRVRGAVTPIAEPWRSSGTAEEATRHRAFLALTEVTGRGRTAPTSAVVEVTGHEEWQGLAHGAIVVVTGRLGPSDPWRPASGELVASAMTVLARPSGIDRSTAALRAGLLRASEGLPADARGLVPGAAVGDTTRVPPDLHQALRDTGLLHLVAVSGAHFAVVGLAVLGLASALRLPRVVRAVLSAAAVLGFMLLVHPEPSVVRAAVMGTLGAVGLLLGRRGRALPALGAAVLVLIVLDPWLARSLGFTLSVTATAAIVLLAPGWARALQRWAAPRWLAVALAVPAAAQVACAPVLLLVDPAVSSYAVPANLLVAPVVAPATLLGLAATLVAPWAPDAAGVLAALAGGATWWISTVARRGAALPGARVGWLEGPEGAAVLVALIVLLTSAAHGSGRAVAALRGAQCARDAGRWTRTRRTRCGGDRWSVGRGGAVTR